MSPGQITIGSRLAKLEAHAFELSTAIIWFLVGINYLLNDQTGERSAIGDAIPPFDIIWSCFYVVGGPLVLLGIRFASQRIRVAGLALLMWGLFMNAVAAFASEPLESRDFVYLVVFGSCLLKILAVMGLVQSTKSSPWGRDHASSTST